MRYRIRKLMPIKNCHNHTQKKKKKKGGMNCARIITYLYPLLYIAVIAHISVYDSYITCICKYCIHKVHAYAFLCFYFRCVGIDLKKDKIKDFQAKTIYVGKIWIRRGDAVGCIVTVYSTKYRHIYSTCKVCTEL